MLTFNRARTPEGLGERGSVAVEFAVILPLLLLVTMGVVNFGYLAWQKLRLDQAVSESARMAVTPNSNGGTNGSAVDDFVELSQLVLDAAGGMFTSEDVYIYVNPPGAPDAQTAGCKQLDVGDQLKVRTEYATQLIIPMPLPGLGSSDRITLTSEAVYRCEWTGR